MEDYKNNGNNSGSEGDKSDLSALLSRALSGKGEGRIWQMIVAEAERGRRAGTLTDEELNNFYNAVAPALDGFKRQKLKTVITRLKSIK